MDCQYVLYKSFINANKTEKAEAKVISLVFFKYRHHLGFQKPILGQNLLKQMIDENRKNKLENEVYFFYEGLKENSEYLLKEYQK